ncbi:hypothetical protein [Pedobacter sp. MC2016-24]|uniref:hypothetical protein n=1 Tax=Pedobacter sp. MC2016-24 TaxID=2780090 RepID=UPI00187EC9E5|nr:hypothetical protein [Pedobacter sp. MC2016-24]MBE9601774.1 hypothetical protein [Pedobacter sp. MC2016-24]
MAKFDGKHVRGVIGNSVVKTGPNGQIIQSKPENVRQTVNTKKSARLFGQASTLSKYIRTNLRQTYDENGDMGMINRLTTLNRVLLAQCLQAETQTFIFTADSFSKLAGFEFNTRSPLANSLWVEPEMSLLNNMLQIRLPAIAIPQQLKFPVNANLCDLELEVAIFSLQPCYGKTPYRATIEIAKNQTAVPAQSWELELPEGCLAVAAIGLKYFSLYKNIKKPLNSEKFHPAGIIDAIFKPGHFNIPQPIKSANRVQGSGWSELDNLQL